MDLLNIKHIEITKVQRSLFNQLSDDIANGIKSNTMAEHSRIALESFIAVGMNANMATQFVAESLQDLLSRGVLNPTRIPWH